MRSKESELSQLYDCILGYYIVSVMTKDSLEYELLDRMSCQNSLLLNKTEL